tara:strand:+ start:581 stop:1003 length:423 start_codon:yes stop_codon:yes gene_type:complete
MTVLPPVVRHGPVLRPEHVDRVLRVLEREQVLAPLQKLDGDRRGPLGEVLERVVVEDDVHVRKALHPLLTGDAFGLPDLLGRPTAANPDLLDAVARSSPDRRPDVVRVAGVREHDGRSLSHDGRGWLERLEVVLSELAHQ